MAEYNKINKISLQELDVWLQGQIGLISGLDTDVGAIYPGATKVENIGGGKIRINDVEHTVYAHPATHSATMIDGLSRIAVTGRFTDLIGTPTSFPASDVYPWAKAAVKPTYTPSEVSSIPMDNKGAALGVAELDSNAKVVVQQLPTGLVELATMGVIGVDQVPPLTLSGNIIDNPAKVAILGGMNSALKSVSIGGGGGGGGTSPANVMFTLDNKGRTSQPFNLSLAGKGVYAEIKNNKDPIRLSTPTTIATTLDTTGLGDSVDVVVSGELTTLEYDIPNVTAIAITDLPKLSSIRAKSSPVGVNTQTNTIESFTLKGDTCITAGASMFKGCSKLKTLPVFNSSMMTDTSDMLNGCTLLSTIPLIDTSKTTNASRMFAGCIALTAVPLLDMSKAADMSEMFSDCTGLVTIPEINVVSAINLSKIVDRCISLATCKLTNISTSISFKDIHKLDAVSIKYMISHLVKPVTGNAIMNINGCIGEVDLSKNDPAFANMPAEWGVNPTTTSPTVRDLSFGGVKVVRFTADIVPSADLPIKSTISDTIPKLEISNKTVLNKFTEQLTVSAIVPETRTITETIPRLNLAGSTKLVPFTDTVNATLSVAVV